MIRTGTRNYLRRLSRQGLAVLVLLSLNLAAMPCSMALEPSEANAHCPSLGGQEMAHHGDDKAPMPPDCIMMQSDCCKPGQVPLDSRGGVDKNLDQDLPVLVLAENWPALNTLAVVGNDARPPDPGNHFPPLRKLLCVYLD